MSDALRARMRAIARDVRGRDGAAKGADLIERLALTGGARDGLRRRGDHAYDASPSASSNWLA